MSYTTYEPRVSGAPSGGNISVSGRGSRATASGHRGGGYWPIVLVDNHDGTFSLTGFAIVDNGDGTISIPRPPAVDSGNGTFTLTT